MDFLSLKEIFPEENTLSFMFMSVNRNLLEWPLKVTLKRETMWGLLSCRDITEQLWPNQRWKKNQMKMVRRVELERMKECSWIKPSPDWLMYQKLLTTWNMTPSLDWHHIFPAISLCSWEGGNEETKLIVMKYRALWVTALGRLSLPANAFYTTSWLKLDFEYQSFPQPKVWVLSFLFHHMEQSPTTGFFLFIRTLKEWPRASECLNIIDVHCLYNEFTINS